MRVVLHTQLAQREAKNRKGPAMAQGLPPGMESALGQMEGLVWAELDEGEEGGEGVQVIEADDPEGLLDGEVTWDR